MLLVEDLQAAYGDSKVLFGMSLGVQRGQVVTLLGRNGMGKTTTVRTIFGLLKPRGGRVSIDGVDVTGAAPHRIARLGMGLVPEGRLIFPDVVIRIPDMAIPAPPSEVQANRMEDMVAPSGGR